MGGFLFFVFIVLVLVIGNVTKKSGTRSNAARQRLRTYAAPRAWPQQQEQQPAWAPARPEADPADVSGIQEAVAEITSAIEQRMDDPDSQLFPPAPTPESRAAADVRNPAASGSTQSVSATSAQKRYVGSAALESTLDSTIESSLLGIPEGPTTASVAMGGRTIALPQGVEARVVAYLGNGHEVAAVRLICDEMDCGILDAMRTVSTLS